MTYLVIYPTMLPPPLKLPLTGVTVAPSASLSPHLASPIRLLSPKASPRYQSSILATSASILSLTSLADTDPLLRASRRLNTANITALLSPFPSHTITQYVNLPAQRDGLTPLQAAVTAPLTTSTHPGALFSTVQLLLSYGADPNRLNSAHSTSLHLACDSGREDVIVLLLVHGADPRLVNSRGQRCWESRAGQASVAGTGERSKLEVLVKRVWEDLRREKERQIMAAVTAATNHPLLSPAGGFSSASSLAAHPATPAFFHRQHYQHDWYDAQSSKSLRSLLSKSHDSTPLLAKALLWDESLREKEQQEQRVQADEERRKVGQRHSLLHRMQRTMSETDQMLQARRQRRQTIRSGDPTAALLAQQQIWREQEQQRHLLQRQQLAASQQSKQLYERLQQAEDAGRVHEVRAVMNEYERAQVPGKRERLLRQMRRNSLWGVVEDRRRKKEAREQDSQRRTASVGGKGRGANSSDAYAFITEPEGQEADPLPVDDEQAEEKQQETETRAESEREKAEREALNDPTYFPGVPIRKYTRAYLSRSLTEHMTIIPPPPHLLPLAVQPSRTLEYPPVTVMASERMRDEKEQACASSGVGHKQNSEVVWRDVGWQPSTLADNADRGLNDGTARQTAPRRQNAVPQTATRSKKTALDKASESATERQDAALLSAYIMREVDSTLRKRDTQRNQPTFDQQSIEQRKQLIQLALPDLSPSSSLYATLLASTTPLSSSAPHTPLTTLPSPHDSMAAVSFAEAGLEVGGMVSTGNEEERLEGCS